MASFTPTLVSGGSAAVTVTMPGYSYSAFINSMTSLFYFLYYLSVDASDWSQIQQNYSWNLYDAEGNLSTDVIPYAPDPNAIQPTADIFFRDKQYILNGRACLDFDLLPHQSITLTLYAITFNPADLLENVSTGKRGFTFINDIQNYLHNFSQEIQPMINYAAKVDLPLP